MKNRKYGFTFIELVISMAIMVILSGIGFISYIQYIGDSRDSQRKSDLSHISSALKIYKQKRGYYPIPGSNFNITYSGTTVAYQGLLDKNVRINTLEKIPIDPKTKNSYFYSITKNKQEFQIAGSLEKNNENDETSIVNGSYKTISRNILPTLLLATGATIGTNIEIKSGTIMGDINRKLFIYDNQIHNIPYVLSNNTNLSDGINFDDLLNQMLNTNDFWENSDFRNCSEIEESGKLIIPLSATPFEYQIITDTGVLVNTGCTL